MWQKVVERFEERAPGAVMAHLAMDQALPASWIDEVFEANRGRQYSRNLLFSSVVELMLPVTLGLRPSLHAEVRKLDQKAGVVGGAVCQDRAHQTCTATRAGTRQRRAVATVGRLLAQA